MVKNKAAFLDVDCNRTGPGARGKPGENAPEIGGERKSIAAMGGVGCLKLMSCYGALTD